MGKFVIANDLTFQIGNFRNDYSLFYITTPMVYSLLDLLDIIKIFAGYTGEYEYDFYSIYYKTYFSSKYKQNDLEKITIDEFMGISPSMICSFGPLKMKISKASKSLTKWKKIYPEVFMGYGNFPEENEFNKLKNISSEKVAEFFNKNFTNLALTYYVLPEIKKQNKDDFKDYNEKLKTFFKNKYKMSEEINEGTWNSNKIIKKP